MLESGVAVDASEKPCQPKSFNARTTSSTGQAKRLYCAAQNSFDWKIALTTARIDVPFCW